MALVDQILISTTWTNSDVRLANSTGTPVTSAVTNSSGEAIADELGDMRPGLALLDEKYCLLANAKTRSYFSQWAGILQHLANLSYAFIAQFCAAITFSAEDHIRMFPRPMCLPSRTPLRMFPCAVTIAPGEQFWASPGVVVVAAADQSQAASLCSVLHVFLARAVLQVFYVVVLLVRILVVHFWAVWVRQTQKRESHQSVDGDGFCFTLRPQAYNCIPKPVQAWLENVTGHRALTSGVSANPTQVGGAVEVEARYRTPFFGCVRLFVSHAVFSMKENGTGQARLSVPPLSRAVSILA